MILAQRLRLQPLIAFALTLPAFLAAKDVSSQETAQFQLEENLRIGHYDRPGYALTRVGSIRIAPDGRVYVAQPSEGLVRVYRSDGTFLRQIGRRGQGPGEFQNLTEIGLRGDSLWVSDIAHSRITLFSPDGQIEGVRTIRGPLLPGVGRPVMVRAMLHNGRYLAAVLQDHGRLAEGGDSREVYYEVDDQAEPVGEFGSLNLTGSVKRIRIAGRALSFIQPLQGEGALVLSSDGRFVMLAVPGARTERDRAGFQLTVFRSFADTVFTRYYSSPAVPVSTTEADSIRDAFHRSLSSMGIASRAASQIASDSLVIPEFHPPVSTVVMSSDGSSLIAGPQLTGGLRNWTLIGVDGRVRGHFSAPADLVLHDMGGDHVWGSITDENDVPFVVRYRLRSRPGR